MPDIMGTIVVALIGGAVVYITTGPALGATRSRRAVRELLEIQSALRPTDVENRRKVRALVDREVLVLEAMGDTRQRVVNAVLVAWGSMLAVGVLAMMVRILIPSPSGKEVMLYVAATVFLLASLIPLGAAPFAAETRPRWWGKVGAILILSAVSTLLVAMAILIVQDTSYWNQLLKSWKAP